MRQLDGGRLRNPHAQEDVLSTRPPEANAPNPREAQSASARFHLAMKDLGMARPAAPGTLVQEALCTAPTWITPPRPLLPRSGRLCCGQGCRDKAAPGLLTVREAPSQHKSNGLIVPSRPKHKIKVGCTGISREIDPENLPALSIFRSKFALCLMHKGKKMRPHLGTGEAGPSGEQLGRVRGGRRCSFTGSCSSSGGASWLSGHLGAAATVAGRRPPVLILSGPREHGLPSDWELCSGEGFYLLLETLDEVALGRNPAQCSSHLGPGEGGSHAANVPLTPPGSQSSIGKSEFLAQPGGKGVGGELPAG